MYFGRKRGQGMAPIIGGIVGIIVATILVFSALLPITNGFVGTNNAGYNASNLSGYTGAVQVAQTLPLFFVLGVLLLAIATFLVFRR